MMNARPMSFQMKQLRMISKIVAAPSSTSGMGASAATDSGFSAVNRAQSLLAAYCSGSSF
jgi:hypothetical protein